MEVALRTITKSSLTVMVVFRLRNRYLINDNPGNEISNSLGGVMVAFWFCEGGVGPELKGGRRISISCDCLGCGQYENRIKNAH